MDNDFSGIPSLDDVQGLENYVNNEQIQNLGIQPAQQQVQDTPTDSGAQQPSDQGYSSTQIKTILERLDSLNARLDAATNSSPNTAAASVSTPQPMPSSTGYSEVEQNFIRDALSKGYSLQDIDRVIASKRAGVAEVNADVYNRISDIENTLRAQEYLRTQNEFISNLSAFGEKWGLSEQDLVTFGKEAFAKGINIASPNIDFETVFRAVYPQQYAIRSQRMSPSQTSQIYGGSSFADGTRQQANKLTDQYVDSFLKQAMPSYFSNGNK